MMDSTSSDTAHATELLARVPFLEGAPREELELLAERSVTRRFARARDVIVQGEFGHSMFVLCRGRVSIYADGEQGERLHLASADEPGWFFGEGALLGRGVRSATVRADADTELIEIERNRFDLLARRHHAARPELERYYSARVISTYTRLHRYLGKLDEASLQSLFAGATLKKAERHEVVCRVGDAADTVMLVMDGVLQAVRPGTAGTAGMAGGASQRSILAYFNTHDIAGVHDGERRDYELLAMGQAEIIYFERAAFAALEDTHPLVFARFGKDDMRRRGALSEASTTVFASAQALLSEGVEVESLLVINLDRCVRCGNCVKACHDRHEFTRLDRRGPIFRRRQKATVEKYEHVMLPSSCRHCRDPECMIGCPTGAIQRFPNGDVDINDNCIGCDNCARKCPYGNITMRPLTPAEAAKRDDEVTKQAIKCNLCRGYEYANCVHECPHGAIIRVDPLRYFEELTMVMEPEQIEFIKARNEAAEDHQKQRIRPRSTRFILYSLIFFALASVTVGGLYLLSPEPRSGRSAWGLGFGSVAALCVLLAMVQGARKRVRTAAIGNLEIWTQFHMVVGALGFFIALAHTGFAITGVFTTFLLVVFGLQVGTGFLGQLLYMMVPSMITRLERGGNARLIEDLVEEAHELERGTSELSATLDQDSRRFLATHRARAVGSLWQRFSAGYDADKKTAAARRLLGEKQAELGQRDTMLRMFEDGIRSLDVKAQIVMHRSLRVWLVLHLALTGALAVSLAAHIITNLLLLV